MKLLDCFVNTRKLPEDMMVRLLILFLVLPHYAATAPKVSADISGSGQRVMQGQAAYVNFSMVGEIMIKCTSREAYTEYAIHMWTENGAQRTLVPNGKPKIDMTFSHPLSSSTFLSGGYWCVGRNGDKETSSDIVYLGTPPKVTLKQMKPFPENGETANFVCEVTDAFSRFNIDREIDYRYENGSGNHRDISSMPGSEPKGSKLVITGVMQEWAKDVKVLCRVKWLKVQNSTSGYYNPQGLYYLSKSVAISFAMQNSTLMPNQTAIPLILQPAHIGAIAIVSLVLVALVVLVPPVLIVVLVRRRRQTHPDDSEQGLATETHHGQVRAPGNSLVPMPNQNVVFTLPGAVNSGEERLQAEGDRG